MIRKEKNHSFSIDKQSIKNIETYIRLGKSMKEALKIELLKYIEENDSQNLFLSNCIFYENIDLSKWNIFSIN